eukprot:PITA_14336
MGERRGNWINALQEFDLKIKLANIVQAQELCRLVAEALEDKEGASEKPEVQSMQNEQVELREEPLWINEMMIYERQVSEALLDLDSWCLEKDDTDHVLKEMHNGPAGGHYGGETTAHKILRVGYYWPTVFRDSHAYARKCKVCQTAAGRERKPTVPLRSVMTYRLFQQWGLDVIGEITPNSSQQHKYILTMTNYFTRWTEAIPLWKVNEDEVISFVEKFTINRVTPKVALGNSPYFLVYGKEAILPPNVTLPSLQLSQDSRGTPSTLLQERINQLMRLEEFRDKARNKFRNHQMIVKRWFDHHLARDKYYQVGELLLKWDKLNEPKGKHMKFQHLWLGLFQVVEKIGQGTYRLKTLQGEIEKIHVNGQHLKRYF